jgi:hypothetical protein
MGSGIVTEQDVSRAPVINALTTTFTAYQLSTVAVGASKYLVTVRIGITDLMIWNEC